MRRTVIPPILFPLAAGALWGCIGLFVRHLQAAGIQNMDVVSIRVGTATLLFWPLVFLRHPAWMRIRLRDGWCFAGMGIGSIVFFNFCYFTTMQRASLSTAAILLYSAPAMVVLLSAVWFKEKLTARKTIACLMAFLGCVWATGGMTATGPFASPGTLLTGLGAGLGFAFYSLFGRCAVNRGYNSTTITAYAFLFALLGTLPFLHPAEIGQAIRLHPSVLLWSLGLGTVGTLLPYWLYAAGLRRMDNGTASILGSVEPVVAALMGMIVFHEPFTLANGAGILLVLGSVLLLGFSSSRNRSTPVPIPPH